jgi:hypothetical protein
MPRQRQASSCPRLSSGQTIAPHLLHCDAEQRGDRCLTQRISLVDRIGAVAEVLLLDDDAILDNYETVALRCDLSRQLGCCRQRRTVQACAGCGKKAKSTQLVQRRNGAAGSAAGSWQRKLGSRAADGSRLPSPMGIRPRPGLCNSWPLPPLLLPAGPKTTREHVCVRLDICTVKPGRVNQDACTHHGSPLCPPSRARALGPDRSCRHHDRAQGWRTCVRLPRRLAASAQTW